MPCWIRRSLISLLRTARSDRLHRGPRRLSPDLHSAHSCRKASCLRNPASHRRRFHPALNRIRRLDRLQRLPVCGGTAAPAVQTRCRSRRRFRAPARLWRHRLCMLRRACRMRPLLHHATRAGTSRKTPRNAFPNVTGSTRRSRQNRCSSRLSLPPPWKLLRKPSASRWNRRWHGTTPKKTNFTSFSTCFGAASRYQQGRWSMETT